MESNAILNSQISESSFYGDYYGLYGRLNHPWGWAASAKTNNEWLQIDLGSKYPTVRRIATQGLNDGDEWVTKYKLDYGNDGTNFYYYMEQGQNIHKVN